MPIIGEPFEEREGQELSPLVSDPDDKDDWIIRWRNVIEDDSYRLLSTMSLPPIPEEDEEEGAHSIGINHTHAMHAQRTYPPPV